MKKIFLICAIIGLSACSATKAPIELNGERVFFGFDSADVSKEAKANLLGQSLYMKNNPDVNILIAGNCDERGTTDYNLALGSVRATNAGLVLQKDGIESSRIKTITYGKERPTVKGSTEEAWQQNRNATTTIIE